MAEIHACAVDDVAHLGSAVRAAFFREAAGFRQWAGLLMMARAVRILAALMALLFARIAYHGLHPHPPPTN